MIKTPNQIGLARVEGELPRVSLDIESSGGVSLDIETLSEAFEGKTFWCVLGWCHTIGVISLHLQVLNSPDVQLYWTAGDVEHTLFTKSLKRSE